MLLLTLEGRQTDGLCSPLIWNYTVLCEQPTGGRTGEKPNRRLKFPTVYLVLCDTYLETWSNLSLFFDPLSSL